MTIKADIEGAGIAIPAADLCEFLQPAMPEDQ
jgi:hypothetical protein